MKLVAVQHEHPEDPRRDVPDLVERAARAVEDGGLAVLPEYFYKPAGEPLDDRAREQLGFVEDALVAATEDVDGALAATVPREDRHNTVVVAEDGRTVLEQPKLYPTPAEREAGITPGEALDVAKVQGVRVGVLVCADVLALDLVDAMADLEPDVVAVPVLSPNRDSDVTRSARTSVFVARAWDLGAYVVKAGGFSRPDVVGRSLITAPWGLLAQAPDPYEPALLGAPFDGGRLDVARAPFEELGTDGEAGTEPS